MWLRCAACAIYFFHVDKMPRHRNVQERHEDRVIKKEVAERKTSEDDQSVAAES